MTKTILPHLLPWWRLSFCWLGVCPHRLYEDEGGCGGQCIRCGKIAGYVTRDELRRYAERERQHGR